MIKDKLTYNIGRGFSAWTSMEMREYIFTPTKTDTYEFVLDQGDGTFHFYIYDEKGYLVEETQHFYKGSKAVANLQKGVHYKIHVYNGKGEFTLSIKKQK